MIACVLPYSVTRFVAHPLTNRWEDVQPDLGEMRETQLITDELFFKYVLDKGPQIVRHDNTPQRVRSIVSHLIQKIQVELVDEKRNFEDTAAGVELNKKMEELISKISRWTSSGGSLKV